MKTTIYRFSSTLVQGTQDIEAIDGFTALKEFRKTDLYQKCPVHTAKGKGFSSWSLGIVCECGCYAGNHQFCSESCFENFMKKVG